MKRVSIDDLKTFLTRLKRRSDDSPEIVQRLQVEYSDRLASASGSGPHEPDDYIVTTLRPLIKKLTDILEELELRYFANEFNADDLRDELSRRSLSRSAMDLMKMIASLDAYRETIETLAGSVNGLTSAATKPRDEVSVEGLNIDRVLSEFAEINVFADYQEGDAVYDHQYAEEDRQILNRLFFDILDGYIEPLIVGFKSVIGGNNSPKLFAALLASIRPLRRSAETMGFSDLEKAFASLKAILNQAQETGNLLSADRIQFVRAYEQLTKSLPNEDHDRGLMDLFDSERASNSMILQLIASPVVQGWMIQALLEIGITDRKKLLSSTAEEIRAVTGLPFDQCRELLLVCRREIEHMG
ncbi:hypothetical protein JXA80_02160 [bacterium]|nr:hypothetical protein [candidate division CSSED10-310 bacterium]